MPISIKDVAARAGVSTATVSHVLNGTRRTQPVTRERVLAAVAELGYTLNRAAQNLAAGRSSLLGLIISDIRNPFFPDLTAAFQDQALMHRMDAVVLNTNYDAQRTLDCVVRLIGLRVPGVAILTSQIDPAVIQELASKRVSAVYLDLGRVDAHIANIVIDYEQGIAEALEHLVKLGHRAIGYIGGPVHLPSAQRRKQAFVETAAKFGVAPAGIMDSDFTVQGGYFAASKLLTNHKPTALIGGNDLAAIGSLHCAYDRGMQVPADLSVVGFDDIAFAQYTQPALTSVSIPRQEIGRVAFQALWQMISQKEDAVGREYHVETRLVCRQSTAPVRACAQADVA
ncbi:MAG: LacI family DNA-binding transcriptional regulator [Bryobacterales bacterium]|nr:LacI family DNA-binding transcriptional regulator [Bryobacterales bacterium]